MNRSELVTRVSYEARVSRRVAAATIDCVLDNIKSSVARDGRMALTGFGTFERRLRAPRVLRNPRTKRQMVVPARRVVAFRPSKDFRDAVARPG